MSRYRKPSDLDLTHQIRWSVEQLAARWNISEKRVRQLLEPHRGKCHLQRRGRHPRLCLWAPKEVVAAIDRERAAIQKPAA
jgi:hypothetical protein